MFNAGIDPAAAAAAERKRLEKEATAFDLWKGSDFLPEEDPNNGELLLDELEQEDILNELLQNAMYVYLEFFQFTSKMTHWDRFGTLLQLKTYLTMNYKTTQASLRSLKLGHHMNQKW